MVGQFELVSFYSWLTAVDRDSRDLCGTGETIGSTEL